MKKKKLKDIEEIFKELNIEMNNLLNNSENNDNSELNEMREMQKQTKEIVNSRINFANENKDQIRNYRGLIIYLIEQFFEAKNEVLEYIKNKYDCILFKPTTEFESDFNA